MAHNPERRHSSFSGLKLTDVKGSPKVNYTCPRYGNLTVPLDQCMVTRTPDEAEGASLYCVFFRCFCGETHEMVRVQCND